MIGRSLAEKTARRFSAGRSEEALTDMATETSAANAPKQMITGVRLIIFALLIGVSAFIFVNREKLALTTVNSLAAFLVGGSAGPDGKTVSTSIYDAAVTALSAPADPGEGGAVAALGNDIFLITRLGDFWRLDEKTDEFVPLKIEAPGEVVEGEFFYRRPKDFASLGYKDLILRKRANNRIEATISRARINRDIPCISIVVYQTEFAPEDLTPEGAPDSDWREVWQSSPCIDSAPGTFPFQSGGDMAFLPDGRLGIFVGDFGNDGHNRKTPGIDPQDLGNDYGKVHAIDVGTGVSEIFSYGHRNPGGLVVDLDGAVWVSEHGPQGGDELNRVEAGGNYGWPLETYGVHYGTKTWPPDATTGVQDRFIRPIYAFVPSMAMSSLAVADGSEFPNWRGDLILGTLKYQRLMRMRIREGRVILAEPLPLGARVRDVTVDAKGRIYVKDDNRDAVYRLTNATSNAAPAQGPVGVLAMAGCAACHQIAADAPAQAAAPSLQTVFGRNIASQRGYAYSSALKDANGAWTEERLSAFLTDPQGFAPGTTMPAADLTETQITDVIAALKQTRHQ
ncbi:MAG: PQQ-dependent sugar dehydrogenase [Pseudomonadota bacterium]